MILIGKMLVVLLGMGVSVASADPPPSVFDLLNRVPDPPSTAKDALRWFDREGHLGHSVVLALKDEIAQYRNESQQLAQDTSQDEDRAALILGLDHVGIDAARLQTDRIYSVQIKEQLERMTIEEKMTLAQQILEPKMAAQQAGATLQEKESQVVQAALVVAKAFPQRRAAWRTGTRVDLVNQFGEIPHLVPPKTLERPQPTAKWGSAECQAECLARWQEYGNALWPLILERETEILRKRREVLQEYKTYLAEEFMREGQTRLGATLYGSLAISPENRKTLAQYHQGLLAEIIGLIDLTEAAAKQAADVIFGGVEKLY